MESAGINRLGYNLSSLLDVYITNAASGNIIQYNGQGWVNSNITLPSGSYEPALGSPFESGYILSSDISGTRSWIAPASASASSWITLLDRPINLVALGNLSDSIGWLHNDGSGSISYSIPTHSDIGLSNVENTALSTWVGSTNITTLGDITNCGNINSSGSLTLGSPLVDVYISSATNWNSAYIHSTISTGSVHGLVIENVTQLGSGTTGSGLIVLNELPTLINPILGDASLTKITNLTDNGFVKTTDSSGSLSIDTNIYQTVFSSGSLTESTSNILTIIGGTNSVIGSGTSISVQKSSASTDGYLSSTDWNTFYNKQNIINGLGFIKASGSLISYDNSTFLTENQNITLTGVISGSGTTNITVSSGSGYYIPTTTDQSNWNGLTTFPGFGTDHATAAYGDHLHTGVYEPVISTGSVSQYWRGDKSWQTLDKSAVGLGSVEDTALSTWAGSTNITTLGTVETCGGLSASGSIGCGDSLTINKTNIDYTNVGGAGSHIIMTNPSATGQNVISSFVNGNLSAKWRTDYDGNVNWITGNGGYVFYTGGDYPTGVARMSISSIGLVGIGGTSNINQLLVNGNVRINPGTDRTKASMYIADRVLNMTPHALLCVDRVGPIPYNAIDETGAARFVRHTDPSGSVQPAIAYGIESNVSIGTGGATNGNYAPALVIAGKFISINLAAGTVTDLIGISTQVQHNSWMGGGAATISTNAIGVKFVAHLLQNGTMTNAWGAYFDDQTVGGTENAAIRFATEGKLSWNNDITLYRSDVGVLTINGTLDCGDINSSGNITASGSITLGEAGNWLTEIDAGYITGVGVGQEQKPYFSFEGNLLELGYSESAGEIEGGGSIALYANNGGATSGDGGSISIQAGSAANEGDGGSVAIQVGYGAGAGANGVVNIYGNTVITGDLSATNIGTMAALANTGSSTITTVGALASGSITSGFGAIDIGPGTLTCGNIYSKTDGTSQMHFVASAIGGGSFFEHTGSGQFFINSVDDIILTCGNWSGFATRLQGLSGWETGLAVFGDGSTQLFGTLTLPNSNVLTGNSGSVGFSGGITLGTPLADAYISSAVTWNSKQNAFSSGSLTETGSSILTITGGTNSVIGSGTSISVQKSSASTDGYLSSEDWNTFNSKQDLLTNPIIGSGSSGQIAIFNNGTSLIGIASGSTFNKDFETSISNIKMNGEVSVGFLENLPRADHVHPIDTSREAVLAKGNLTEIESSVIVITGGSGSVIGSGVTLQITKSSSSISGYLDSTDWNTFYNKQNAYANLTTIGNLSNDIGHLYNNGSGSLTWDNTYAPHPPVTIGSPSNGLSLNIQEISIASASISTTGVLSSTDWNTFYNKQNIINGLGFIKASGSLISYDNSTFLTENQNITLTGVISGSGTTNITVSSGSGYY
ncbi:MAG: hypothetical protein WC979_07935, partial [Candidatus Pacearchaeota archaeon]